MFINRKFKKLPNFSSIVVIQRKAYIQQYNDEADFNY